LRQVNLGIIGLGNQGRIHLRNALHIKGAKVLGVADVSKKALGYAKKIGVRSIYDSYENLLKNRDIDGVIISLPNFLHLESSIKAAEAGKHIFLEKPLARNVHEGEKILTCIKNNGVKFMINFPLRFNSTVKEIREKIAEGIFGEVMIVEATHVSGGPFSSRGNKFRPVPVSSWWFDEKLVGGGALLDLGSHMIDLLTWYFGEADIMESYLGYVFKMELEDVATCMLKFKDGPIATVKAGWFSKDHMVSIQICGTAKNMWVRISPQGTFRTVWGDIKRKISRRNNDSFYLALEYFVRCLQEDEDPHPSVEEGLQCLRIVSNAYEKALKVKA